MPQMKPMNWLYFFLIFSMIIMLFNMMNFYIKLDFKKTFKPNNYVNKKNMNWKW